MFRRYNQKQLASTQYYYSKRFFLGSNDFKEMVLWKHKPESTVPLPFVDKSLMIPSIIGSSGHAMLITQPRRSGKSMNIDMLYKFLAIHLDDKKEKASHNPYRILYEGGTLIDEVSQELEVKNPSTLTPLQIAGDHIIMKKQGKYPVIKLDFKDLTSRNVKSITAGIIQQLQSVYEQYDVKEFEKLSIGKTINAKMENNQGLIDQCNKDIGKINSKLADCTDKEEQQKLEKYFEEFKTQREELKAQQEELKVQLKSIEQDPKAFLQEMGVDLCKKLHDKYKEQVFVLIDEYDKPVNAFIEIKDITAFTKEEHDKAIDTISGFLSAIAKSNQNVIKVVLFGIFKTLKIEGNSGLNNIIEHSVDKSDFIKYFGFTEEEIRKQLFSEKSLPDDVQKKIREFYNGYNAWTSEGKHITIYSPWSAIRFVEDFMKNPAIPPESYWVKSGSNIVLGNFKLSKIQLDKLAQLRYGQEFSLSSPEPMIDIDLSAGVKDSHITYILLHSGYITLAQDKDGKQKSGFYRIPNKEVEQHYRNEVLAKWLERVLPNTDYNELAGKILEHIAKPNNLQLLINDYILNKVQGNGHNEEYFRGILFALIELHQIQNPFAKYLIRPEIEVNRKRMDILLTPNDLNTNYVIIEIKEVSDDSSWRNTLSNAGFSTAGTKCNKKDIAKVALLQIISNKYLDIINQEPNGATLQGISFYKNQGKWEVFITQVNILSSEIQHAKLAAHSVDLTAKGKKVSEIDTYLKQCFPNLVISTSDDRIGGAVIDFTNHHLAMLRDSAELNADLLSLPWVGNIPAEKKGYNIAIIDSDEYYADRAQPYFERSDINLVYQDIQGTTSSCVDNAMQIVSQALNLGLEAFLFEHNQHMVAIIHYPTSQYNNLQDLLNDISMAQINSEISWETYKEIMIGKNFGQSTVTETASTALEVKEFVDLSKDLDTMLLDSGMIETAFSIQDILLIFDTPKISNSDNKVLTMEQRSNSGTTLYRMSSFEQKISNAVTYHTPKPQESTIIIDGFTLAQLMLKTLEYGNTKLDLCFKYVSTFFKYNSYTDLQTLADKYEVNVQVVDAHSARSAYKKIALKAHPDKIGGNAEDFKLAKELSEPQHLEVSINYNQVMSTLERGHGVVRAVHTVTGIIKVVNEPEQTNIITAVTNLGYLIENLASKSIGMKYFYGVAIGYQVYQGDFNGALTSTATMAAYALPGLLMTTAPALAVTLKIGFIAYDAYYAATEVYGVLPAIDLAGETNPFGNVDI